MFLSPWILVSKLSGPLGDAIPPDAEISPELIAALTSRQLSAEDIEIITAADGKSIIRLKSEVWFEMSPSKALLPQK